VTGAVRSATMLAPTPADLQETVMAPAIVISRVVRLLLGLSSALTVIACGAPSADTAVPATPTSPAANQLDRNAVIAALDYWQSAVGISYVLVDGPEEPRLFIRPGTDGLASQGGGRGLIDGTYPFDNRARTGLVVIEPGGGNYCRGSALTCAYLYRHEIGHALGFLDHSTGGLMLSTPASLTDRERNMVLALYSLPHGARVQPDGTWAVPSTGASGALTDLQAARDIIDWNMNAQGGASYRQLGVITRWELPVRVYLKPCC
jgi:hypothetical protein